MPRNKDKTIFSESQDFLLLIYNVTCHLGKRSAIEKRKNLPTHHPNTSVICKRWTTKYEK